MDSITHTLFGMVIYKTVNKEEMDTKTKRALLFTSLVGSQIPDIDVVSKYFDSQGLYQMWHRGITHSIFMVPIWATLIFLLSYLFWRVKDKRIIYVSVFSILLHITSDLFNAWGTGYFEPFSKVRLSFGSIPIVDFYIWLLILAGFIATKVKKLTHFKVYRIVLILILVHFISQSLQGYMIYQNASEKYDQVALSAGFIPTQFQVIGKIGDEVEISDASIWSEPKLDYTLHSDEDADLNLLFKKNPKAKTLYAWSPFVVIVDDDKRLGIYDPRFYRNGQSFLSEYINKNAIK